MIVDRSHFAPGFRASGVLSGSFARLSGTSAAAPILARQLLLQSAALGVTGPQDNRLGPLVPNAKAFTRS